MVDPSPLSSLANSPVGLGSSAHRHAPFSAHDGPSHDRRHGSSSAGGSGNNTPSLSGGSGSRSASVSRSASDGAGPAPGGVGAVKRARGRPSKGGKGDSADGDKGEKKKGRKKVAKACLACQKSHLTCDDRESSDADGRGRVLIMQNGRVRAV